MLYTYLYVHKGSIIHDEIAREDQKITEGDHIIISDTLLRVNSTQYIYDKDKSKIIIIVVLEKGFGLDGDLRDEIEKIHGVTLSYNF